MKKNSLKKPSGFTLIELLVVIAIIGLLSTLAVVSLNNARQKSRDAKRLSDIKQMQTAFELFFSDCGGYPADASITFGTGSVAQGGSSGCTGTIVYMEKLPSNPMPRNDGGCTSSEYIYTQTASGASYTLRYCIGSDTQGITGGSFHNATPAGL